MLFQILRELKLTSYQVAIWWDQTRENLKGIIRQLREKICFSIFEVLLVAFVAVGVAVALLNQCASKFCGSDQPKFQNRETIVSDLQTLAVPIVSILQSYIIWKVSASLSKQRDRPLTMERWTQIEQMVKLIPSLVITELFVLPLVLKADIICVLVLWFKSGVVGRCVYVLFGIYKMLMRVVEMFHRNAPAPAA